MNKFNQSLVHEITSQLDANQEISTIIHWLENTEDVYRDKIAHLPKKHVVVYALLVDPTTKQIMLFHHKKSGKLLPCGGHIDKGESALVAGLRELYEEAGVGENELIHHKLSKKLIHLSQTVIPDSTPMHTDVNFWYIFTASSSDQRIDPFQNAQHFQDEFLSCEWYPLANIAEAKIEGAWPDLQHVSGIILKFLG